MAETAANVPIPTYFCNYELPSDEPLGDWDEAEGKPEPAMSVYANVIAVVLMGEIYTFLKQADLGQVVTEVLFRFQPGNTRMRRPDVAYVSYQRWAKDRDLTTGNGWEVVPDLVVEVVSPTDEAEELMKKVYEYLTVGVVEVWVVYPAVRRVHRFRAEGEIRDIGPAGTLDGGAILPGFVLPLTDLFRNQGGTGTSGAVQVV